MKGRWWLTAALATAWPIAAVAEQGLVPLERPAASADVLFLAEDGRQVEVSSHWLGIMVQSISPSLAAQLNLEPDTGVVVMEVLPDSPAARAGLQAHDVIVRIGDETIHGPGDIFRIVGESKDTELTLHAIRKGQPLEIKATPEKRPEGQKAPGPSGYWLDFAPRFGGGDDRFNLRFFGPGFSWRPQELLHHPKGLTISITKESDEPARIVVKRGNESWDVRENELDKLPDDVRPHVERLLGRDFPAVIGFRDPKGAQDFRWQVPREMERFFRFFAPPETHPLPPQEPGGRNARERMERRLDNLTRRLEQLMDEVRQLRREGTEEDAPPQEAPKPEAPTGGTRSIRVFPFQAGPTGRGVI